MSRACGTELHGRGVGGGGRGPHSSGEVDRCATWQGSRGRRNVRFPRTQDAHARFTRAAKGSCQHGVTRATGGRVRGSLPSASFSTAPIFPCL